MNLAGARATHEAGLRLAPTVRIGDVIGLAGPLGAGKTSFARGLLDGLGLRREAPSPTFAIMLTYDPPDTLIPIVHADLYRIEGPGELEELGLLDQRGEAALVIEWPDRLGPFWPGDALLLTFGHAPDGGRSLTADVPEGWKARWPLT